MLAKEELADLYELTLSGNSIPVAKVTLPGSKLQALIAHIREQEAELNGRHATLDALDVEITSLRETVRFLNAVLGVEAKL